MTRYRKPKDVKDLREAGRIKLALGEATGHHHSVYAADPALDLPPAEFFEEPEGRRVLLVLAPCELRHQEHAPIALDPTKPVQARQGDVLLTPIGKGAWEVTRQREYSPEAIRNVAD
jgi:hypothetical protein